MQKTALLYVTWSRSSYTFFWITPYLKSIVHDQLFHDLGEQDHNRAAATPTPTAATRKLPPSCATISIAWDRPGWPATLFPATIIMKVKRLSPVAALCFTTFPSIFFYILYWKYFFLTRFWSSFAAQEHQQRQNQYPQQEQTTLV